MFESDIGRNEIELFYNNITVIPLILKNVKNDSSLDSMWICFLFAFKIQRNNNIKLQLGVKQVMYISIL